MAYTLEQFCTDAREAMKKNPGDSGREIARQKLELLLANSEFIAEHCSPQAAKGNKLLYRDPELDFNVLCHVFTAGSESPPHNHGNSWAIYGQAAGVTDVKIWRRKNHDPNTGHADVEVAEAYKLPTGTAGLFNPGVIHSVAFTTGSRYIRVTGTDLNKLDQDVYDLDKHIVYHGNPGAQIDALSAKRERETAQAKA